jgi:hypothetical protein
MDAQARLPGPRTGVRPVDPGRGWSRLGVSEVVAVTTGHGPERRRTMSAQQQIFPADVLGVLPSALVVLMTILAMLGVIAHAAAA